MRLKQKLKYLLIHHDFGEIRTLTSEKKSILSHLLMFTFDPNEEFRWKAVEALGIATSIWVKKDIEFVRDFCRRLFWMLNDESGNMGWYVPQALGAILAENHESLAEFLPMLLSLLEEDNEEAITCGTLWAIGRVGPINEDYVFQAKEKIRLYIHSNNQTIQTAALNSLQQLSRC